MVPKYVSRQIPDISVRKKLESLGFSAKSALQNRERKKTEMFENKTDNL